MYRFCAIPSVLVIGGLTPLSLRKEKEGMTGREGGEKGKRGKKGRKDGTPTCSMKVTPCK